MRKILVDAGTSWSKLLELYDSENDLSDSPLNAHFSNLSNLSCNSHVFLDKDKKEYLGRTFLFPSSQLSKLGLTFDAATGHMVKTMLKSGGNYENEILALAYGTKKLLNSIDHTTIVDLGSRDVKWVRFEDGKYNDLDWNGACGSATGATVEMLCRFYSVDPSQISISKEKYPVTCGVFAMEKIMDDIAADTPAEIAIAKYIHGIAYNTWNFADKPQKIHLSGGFCLNTCFVKSLELYCEVELLGRHVLLEGLF